jgi:hypothetical protein
MPDASNLDRIKERFQGMAEAVSDSKDSFWIHALATFSATG